MTEDQLEARLKVIALEKGLTDNARHDREVLVFRECIHALRGNISTRSRAFKDERDKRNKLQLSVKTLESK